MLPVLRRAALRLPSLGVVVLGSLIGGGMEVSRAEEAFRVGMILGDPVRMVAKTTPFSV